MGPHLIKVLTADWEQRTQKLKKNDCRSARRRMRTHGRRKMSVTAKSVVKEEKRTSRSPEKEW